MTKATDAVNQTVKAKDDWNPGIPSSLLFHAYWGRAEDSQLSGTLGKLPTTVHFATEFVIRMTVY